MATGDSALFGSCAGGLFNFELADFGTDDCSGVGMSRVGKKFDMVIGNLKRRPWPVVGQLAQNDRASLLTLVTLKWLTSAHAKATQLI